MPMLVIGENFPAAIRQDIDGKTVEFPAVFAEAGNEGHRSGFIARPATFVVDQVGVVRWVYNGDDSASDRPSPVALAKTAGAIAQGK